MTIHKANCHRSSFSVNGQTESACSLYRYMTLQHREWLSRHLEEKGFSEGFRQWMGSNLRPEAGKFSWTFDVKCAQQLYQSYQERQYWDLVESPPQALQINLVRAAESDRLVLAMHTATTAMCQASAEGRETCRRYWL